jgi:hypothetical protein
MNSLITPDWITKETARKLMNSCKFFPNVNRSYDDQYVQGGAKVGATVKARLPQRFVANEGQALQVQAIQDSYVPISLTHQRQVGTSWSTATETTDIEDVRSRYVEPAGIALGNVVDADGLSTVYPDVYNSVGTPGTTPTSNLTYLQAGAKMTKFAAPMVDRCAVLDPLMAVTLANANFTIFNPTGAQGTIWRDGQFGERALMVDDWYQDQNVYNHTTGTFTAATPLTNGATQTGSSLITDGWASGASSLKRGDIFTIAGVYAVNPVSYQSTGQLQQFTVLANISDTTGAMTISISPSIITSGQFQTVTNSAADDSAITVWAANPAGGVLATTVTPQSLLFHPDAFVAVTADLAKPNGGATTSSVRSKTLGLSLRYVQQYNIQTDQNASRFDILYGWATLRPELACRVVG